MPAREFNFLGLNRPGELVQTPLPLPPSTLRNLDYGAKGYVLERIANGVYAIYDSAFYVSMFAVTKKGVVFMDCPITTGDKALAALAEVTKKPVTHVIYSHSHRDHICGCHVFTKFKPKFIGTKELSPKNCASARTHCAQC